MDEHHNKYKEQFLLEIAKDPFDFDAAANVLMDVHNRRIDGGYYPDNALRPPPASVDEILQHTYDFGDAMHHFTELMLLVVQLRTKAAERREHPTFSDVREAWNKIVPMPHFLDDEPGDTIHLRKVREDYRLIAEMIAETMATEYMKGIAHSIRERLYDTLAYAPNDDELEDALTDIVYEALVKDTEKTTEE